jgi:hypothetical protein
VKKPSGRKLVLFVTGSAVYGAIAAFAVVVMAIRTCSMQPDVAATCDTTPILVTTAILGLAYLGLTVLFFGKKISGVD